MVRRALLLAVALAGCDWSVPNGVPCSSNDNCPFNYGCDLVVKKCVSVAGCSENGGPSCFSGYPQTPQVAASGQGATLTWGFGGGNPTGAVMGYGLLRADAESGPWTVLKTVPLNNGQQQNQATDPGPLTPGHTYWYAIAYALTPSVVGQLTPPISFQMPRWSSRASLPTGRYALVAAAVGNAIYALGGYSSTHSVSTVEALDVAAGTWSSRASMPTPRSFLGGGVVNGVVYAVGGTDECNCSTPSRLATNEAFDPAANAWSTRAPMPTGRAELAAAAVGGVLYAVGGVTTATYGVTTVEAYDAAADSWSAKSAIPTARYDAAAAALNGLLYVAGGVDGSGNRLASLEVYDPAADSWTTKASMSAGRQAPGLAALNGLLYAFGGNTPSGPAGSVEVYDPATDRWTPAEAMPPGSDYYMGCTVQGGLLWSVGGFPPTSVYTFTP